MELEAWATALQQDYALPVILLPAPPPGGATVEFAFSIEVAEFDRFFSVDTEVDGLPSVMLRAPTDGECAVEQPQTVEIRGHSACLGSTPRGTTAIIWTEGWTFSVEWSRSVDVDLETEADAVVEWLNEWVDSSPR